METLVVYSQQEQFTSRTGGRNQGSNCRNFQSGSGILRSPPVSKQLLSKNSQKTSPKTPKQLQNKRIVKTSSVPIPLDVKNGAFNDNLFYSELWAGPAYSNSPPPSDLPIPTFSVKPKRTVSLDLPSITAADIDFLTTPVVVAKSAPPSPTREHNKSIRRDFFGTGSDDDEFATKTLRRILNLDE